MYNGQSLKIRRSLKNYNDLFDLYLVRQRGKGVTEGKGDRKRCYSSKNIVYLKKEKSQKKHKSYHKTTYLNEKIPKRASKLESEIIQASTNSTCDQLRASHVKNIDWDRTKDSIVNKEGL